MPILSGQVIGLFEQPGNMKILTLISALLLSPKVVKAARDYLKRMKLEAIYDFLEQLLIKCRECAFEFFTISKIIIVRFGEWEKNPRL